MASTAVVTGGTRGIGLAIARRLAATGHTHVTLLGRNEVAGADAVALLAREGGPCAYEFVACDVAKLEQLERAFEGRCVTTLVNCAGVTEDSLLLRANDDQVQRIVQTNLVGSIHASRLAAKSMLKHRTKVGCIVNIGSVVGAHGNVGQSVYAASKSGLSGLTKSLAKELGPRGVRVNMVEPGYIRTDMTAGLSEGPGGGTSARISLGDGRFGVPEDVANLVGFLCDPVLAGYITGQTIGVDGGLVV
jgi:3-oxoacyl-[acyl-carrier protein] reductase|eukprot:Stramenopile-MAST_4_protein_3925